MNAHTGFLLLIWFTTFFWAHFAITWCKSSNRPNKSPILSIVTLFILGICFVFHILYFILCWILNIYTNCKKLDIYVDNYSSFMCCVCSISYSVCSVRKYNDTMLSPLLVHHDSACTWTYCLTGILHKLSTWLVQIHVSQDMHWYMLVQKGCNSIDRSSSSYIYMSWHLPSIPNICMSSIFVVFGVQY